MRTKTAGPLSTLDLGSARVLEHAVFVRIRHLAHRETMSESDTLESCPLLECQRNQGHRGGSGELSLRDLVKVTLATWS